MAGHSSDPHHGGSMALPQVHYSIVDLEALKPAVVHNKLIQEYGFNDGQNWTLIPSDPSSLNTNGAVEGDGLGNAVASTSSTSLPSSLITNGAANKANESAADRGLPTREAGYLRWLQPMEAELAKQVEYDMDEQDQVWLDSINNARTIDGSTPISYEIFEIIVDKLEKEWFDLVKSIPKKPAPILDTDSKCAICDDGECENSNAIVFCDGCNLAVHQDCYGVPYIPEGQWLCRKCTVSPDKPVRCVLCPNSYGAFKQTTTAHWAHLLCAIWIPDTGVSNTVYMEPIDGVEHIPKSRWKLICYLCRQRVGACIQCANRNCFTAFHVTCAREHGLELKMKQQTGTGELRAYCEKHGGLGPQSYISASGSVTPASTRPNRPGRQSLGAHAPSPSSSLTVVLNPNKNVSSLSSKTQRAYKKSYTSGPPLVPNYVLERVNAYISKIKIANKRSFMNQLCRYWSLKREARRGAPLLKRLHLEPWTASASTRQQSDVERAKKLELMRLLREDLENVRMLTERVRKRERKKLERAQLLSRFVDEHVFMREGVMREFIRKVADFDKHQFFAKPVSRAEAPDYYDIVKNPMDFSQMIDKLTRREYATAASLLADYQLIFDNAFLYNKKESIVHRAAVKVMELSKTAVDELKKLDDPTSEENLLAKHLDEVLTDDVVEKLFEFDPAEEDANSVRLQRPLNEDENGIESAPIEGPDPMEGVEPTPSTTATVEAARDNSKIASPSKKGKEKAVEPEQNALIEPVALTAITSSTKEAPPTEPASNPDAKSPSKSSSETKSAKSKGKRKLIEMEEETRSEAIEKDVEKKGEKNKVDSSKSTTTKSPRKTPSRSKADSKVPESVKEASVSALTAKAPEAVIKTSESVLEAPQPIAESSTAAHPIAEDDSSPLSSQIDSDSEHEDDTPKEVKDVDDKKSFKLFEKGWVLPAGSSRKAKNAVSEKEKKEKERKEIEKKKAVEEAAAAAAEKAADTAAESKKEGEKEKNETSEPAKKKPKRSRPSKANDGKKDEEEKEDKAEDPPAGPVASTSASKSEKTKKEVMSASPKKNASKPESKLNDTKGKGKAKASTSTNGDDDDDKEGTPAKKEKARGTIFGSMSIASTVRRVEAEAALLGKPASAAVGAGKKEDAARIAEWEEKLKSTERSCMVDSKTKFNDGDLVWAASSGFPAFPAEVVGLPLADDAPEKLHKQFKEKKNNNDLVPILFFDCYRSTRWARRQDLRLLGKKEELDDMLSSYDAAFRIILKRKQSNAIPTSKKLSEEIQEALNWARKVKHGSEEDRKKARIGKSKVEEMIAITEERKARASASPTSTKKKPDGSSSVVKKVSKKSRQRKRDQIVERKEEVQDKSDGSSSEEEGAEDDAVGNDPEVEVVEKGTEKRRQSAALPRRSSTSGPKKKKQKVDESSK